MPRSSVRSSASWKCERPTPRQSVSTRPRASCLSRGVQVIIRRPILARCARTRWCCAAHCAKVEFDMPDHYDVLRELGLLPEWRLRAGAAPPCIRPAAPVASDSAPEQTAMLRDVAATDRPARIAALAWTDFAADVAACEACSLCKTRNR